MLKQEISIQTNDFSLADEVALLEEDNLTDGAVVTFTGRVRNARALPWHDREISR